MKYYFSLVLFVLLAYSCSETLETESLSIAQSDIKIELDTIQQEEIDIESNDSIFYLIKPNRFKIDSLFKSDYSTTRAYIYLKEYYLSTTNKQDVQFDEWDSITPCSFTELFQYGIKYEVYNCSEEGGISEKMIFPKIELDSVKHFIMQLFSVEENSWVTNTSYEADGAGCYYGIVEEEDSVKIEIYCGC